MAFFRSAGFCVVASMYDQRKWRTLSTAFLRSFIRSPSTSSSTRSLRSPPVSRPTWSSCFISKRRSSVTRWTRFLTSLKVWRSYHRVRAFRTRFLGGSGKLNDTETFPAESSSNPHMTWLKQNLRFLAAVQLLPALESGEETLVGGQAVLEGVMMRSPHACAIAVRQPNGAIATHSEPVARPSEKHKWIGWPG